MIKKTLAQLMVMSVLMIPVLLMFIYSPEIVREFGPAGFTLAVLAFIVAMVRSFFLMNLHIKFGHDRSYKA